MALPLGRNRAHPRAHGPAPWAQALPPGPTVVPLGHNAVVLLTELVLTSQAVAATPQRGVKIGKIADLLRTASPAEVPVVVAFLAGELRQRQIGVGYAALAGLAAGGDAADGLAPTLTVSEVDAVFAEVGDVTGAGAQAARRRMLAGLFGRATAGERDFLVRLIAGELHQGALEGVMIEAVARAAGVPAGEVRRAHLLGGSLPAVAAADAGLVREERGGRVRPRLPRRGGVEDRRDPDPGPPGRLRGRRVHPDPRRHHRAGPRDRRGGAGPRCPGGRPGRRGGGAPSRRPAAAVPGHGRPDRQPDRCGTAAGGCGGGRGVLRRRGGARARGSRGQVPVRALRRWAARQ